MKRRIALRNKTSVCVTVATMGATFLLAATPASQAATICNEAENSYRGGYVVSGGLVDPAPPAFLRGSQMRVGNDDAAGLDRAADRSPALRQCDVPSGGGGGGGGGGGDTDQ